MSRIKKKKMRMKGMIMKNQKRNQNLNKSNNLKRKRNKVNKFKRFRLNNMTMKVNSNP